MNKRLSGPPRKIFPNWPAVGICTGHSERFKVGQIHSNANFYLYFGFPGSRIIGILIDLIMHLL